MYKILLGLACIVSFAFVLLIWEEADAARFGGGRSFGSKPFMSKPFTKPIPQAMPSVRQQQAPGGSAGVAGAGASRFGGMGGMFGGLLAGTLIGSLLFGGGFQGGGLMDILLIGGLLFLALKIFGWWRSNQAGSYQAPQPASASSSSGNASGNAYGDQNATFNGTAWDSLKDKSPSSTARDSANGKSTYATTWDSLKGEPSARLGGNNQASTQSSDTIEDFDVEDFLRGAKLMYARLNASWDNRDLDDIAQFSTTSFMKAIREQAAEAPQTGRTDIVLVNASLVDMSTANGEQTASVFFSVLLRESDTKAGAAPTDLREVWHFTRPSSGKGQWSLDGIQQTDNG